MQTISPSAITLSAEERDIVLELLDRERTNLPVEIHHTRTAKFRDHLRHRLSIIDALFDRLTPSGPDT
jgi:hypothetical protein